MYLLTHLELKKKKNLLAVKDKDAHTLVLS